MKLCFVVQKGYDVSWLVNKFKNRHSVSCLGYSGIWRTLLDLIKLNADIVFFVGKKNYFLKKYKYTLFSTVLKNIFFPYWKLVWGFIKYLQSRAMYLINLCLYKAVANPDKIIHVDPNKIEHTTKFEFIEKVPSVRGVVKNKFPDEVRKMKFRKERGKYGSLYQRFVLGKKWEETPIITEYYPQAIKESKYTRGLSTPEEILIDYYTKVDPLYYKIKKYGIRVPTVKNPFIDYIFVHIGPKGEIIYTKEGNHRLAISKILGIKSMPCKVWVRHKKWQRIRDIASSMDVHSFARKYPDLVNHPDLDDVLST